MNCGTMRAGGGIWGIFEGSCWFRFVRHLGLGEYLLQDQE